MAKVTLVTGASAGIGRNAALTLAKKGYRVIATARRQSLLEDLAEESVTESEGELGQKIRIIAGDVTDDGSVKDIFQMIARDYGRLDLLFNNAGAALASTNFGDMALEDFTKVMAVNVNGVCRMAHYAYKMMRDQRPQGGRIINNGSISATLPRPGSAAYTASKHAITGLTKSIALDGRAHNIACGQIDIGNAETDMTAKMTKGVLQADGSRKIEPVIDVQHIGDAIHNMASLPLNANVLFMTIMATQMPFVGRG